MTPAERVLAVVGVESPALLGGTAWAFRRFLLLEAAVHAWIVVAHAREPLFHDLTRACAVALTLTAGAGLVPRLATVAARAAFAIMVARLVIVFPDAYNHLVLETVLTGTLALTRADDAGEQQLMLQLARWTTVVVFAWTGLQKVLHGCWFRGEFLTLAIATNPHFGDLFALVVPEEVARVRALTPLRIGGGPFRITAPWLPILTNAVWIAELALPALLLVRRTRWLGVLGSVLFLLGVELVARELVFGVLFLNAIVLFAPGDGYRRAFPLFIGLLVVVLGLEAALPEVWLN